MFAHNKASALTEVVKASLHISASPAPRMQWELVVDISFA